MPAGHIDKQYLLEAAEIFGGIPALDTITAHPPPPPKTPPQEPSADKGDEYVFAALNYHDVKY